jgi:hypothetical protein
MTDSYFIYSEACPKCRSKGEDRAGDNLAVYSDGHKWCYKCDYFVKGDALYSLRAKKEEAVDTIRPPPAVEFSKECLEYLRSFDLTYDEIESNLVGHQDGYMFVTSSYYLVRRLHKLPKVIVKGEVVGNEPVFIPDTGKDTVVLCEDILSAIKISRVAPSCALLKTSIHDSLLYRLSKQFNNCKIWLDPDMYTHVCKNLLPKVTPLFQNVTVVLSDKDPKYYETDKIKEYLNV